MSHSRHAGFGSRGDDAESKEDFVTIGTHFDPAEPTNSTSILATLGRKASKLVDLSSSTYGYDGKRFHGAFTGGFNAGYYNSVGSVEGWRPAEFLSSRTTRAEKRSYEPEDFMDKGDFSEHGINPKQIKVRSTFDQNDIRDKQKPGTSNKKTNEDILRDMIRVKALSIGKKILMSMGWKPGEGVGVKMSRKHRQKLKWSLTQETSQVLPPSPPRIEQSSGVKVYGVTLPPSSFQQTIIKTSRLDDHDDDDDLDDQTYAHVNLPPLDYEVHFQLQKHEHHGIGYKGLESLNLFGHDNLFVQPSVEKQIHNVKIRGQAFGVGIEEDEDDRDLFAVDDLKQYDYELTAPTETNTDVMRQRTQQNNFELKFVRYEIISMPVVYPPPVLPTDFRPGHRFPQSAMPPPPPPLPTTVTSVPPKPVSTQLDANTRGLLLGDLSFLSQPPPVSGGPPPPVPPKETEDVAPQSAPTTSSSLEWDVEKQRSSHTNDAVPISARSQFLNAVKDRFTSSSDHPQFTEQQTLDAALENDLKKAVALNLYGNLTRSVSDWKPNPLLCKRMNIPNPYSDDSYDDSKESKKSRRQLCSNLFEHLFTQSDIVPSLSSTESSPSITNIPLGSSSTIQSPTQPPIVSKKSQPPTPKLEFAPIESFGQEKQERPPLDFFSAIFENQDSDEEIAEEEEVKQLITPLKPATATAPLPSKQIHDIVLSDDSDSSIEELETPDKSSLYYGPTLPATISSSKVNNDNSIWTKLLNTSAQYEEVTHAKKHKKTKKKHHKKTKKHHH